MSRVALALCIALAAWGCRAQAERPAARHELDPAPRAPASEVGGAARELSPLELALAPAELSLEAAFELAERTHPDLAAAHARLDAALSRRARAGRFPNPEAVVRMESAHLDADTGESAEYVAGLSQSLPIGGRLAAAERLAEAEVRRARLELDAVRLEVLSRVRGAFVTQLYAERATGLRGELEQQASELARIATLRQSLGDADDAERLAAELALVEARSELERADALLASARGELAMALAVPERSFSPLAGDLAALAELPAIEDVLRRIADDPRLLAAGAGLSADEARLELASAERTPQLRLDLFYRRLESIETDALDLGLTIPLPLFDSGRGRVEEARALVGESKARLDALQARTESAARLAHERLARAKAMLARFEAEILPRAEALAAVHERRHASGDVALDLLLRARARWSATRLGALEALRETLAAWAELSALLPRLTP